ncbi:2985_t:CDS:2 [Funneliformis caledonium]|uniref:2985_t:CDS:1 n=1 Tax=Funneliformis caledonium TaxID=1117310 RepID=A0A9N9E8J7_9GLOM|nr:2985_t:CDS:2 [Funneliformis caledonium]
MLFLCFKSIRLQIKDPNSLLRKYMFIDNLDEFSSQEFDIDKLESNYFLFNPEKVSLITFKPMIKMVNTTKLELKPLLEQIPMTDLGGFYSALAGKQSFTRKFAERYVTYVGLPLVEKIELKEENNKTTLKDEVQILEKLKYLMIRVQMLEVLLKFTI